MGTAPELAVRNVLRRLGIRYRLSNADLPGNPDLANRSRRWTVFVNGCFWHGHRDCPRARSPRTNVKYWTEKIRRNRDRDTKAVAELSEMGYVVITVWECDLKDDAAIEQKLRDLIGRGG